MHRLNDLLAYRSLNGQRTFRNLFSGDPVLKWIMQRLFMIRYCINKQYFKSKIHRKSALMFF